MSKTKDHLVEVEEIRVSHPITAPDFPHAAVERVIGWIDSKLENNVTDCRFVRDLVEARKNLTELRRY